MIQRRVLSQLLNEPKLPNTLNRPTLIRKKNKQFVKGLNKAVALAIKNSPEGMQGIAYNYQPRFRGMSVCCTAGPIVR